MVLNFPSENKTGWLILVQGTKALRSLKLKKRVGNIKNNIWNIELRSRITWKLSGAGFSQWKQDWLILVQGTKVLRSLTETAMCVVTPLDYVILLPRSELRLNPFSGWDCMRSCWFWGFQLTHGNSRCSGLDGRSRDQTALVPGLTDYLNTGYPPT